MSLFQRSPTSRSGCRQKVAQVSVAVYQMGAAMAQVVYLSVRALKIYIRLALSLELKLRRFCLKHATLTIIEKI